MVAETNEQALYAAFESRDPRFDGKFFVGVSSTGIYCRPVCHAKMPKRENCTFFASAAEAEQAGYRPCMTCRPELAPGRSIVDARSSLARRAAQLLEETCNSRMGMERVAGKLGCSSRHLRRVFEEEHNVTPVQYVQTCRLLLAKSLLTDTRLPIAQVAHASGFGSVRRFNDVFKERYRMPPSRLRRQASLHDGLRARSAALHVGYQPPFYWEGLLAQIAEASIPAIERVEHGRYTRGVRLRSPNGEEHIGWIEVAHAPKKSSLAVDASPDLLPVLPQVIYRVRRMFDTACDPSSVDAVLAGCSLTADPYRSGSRLAGCFDAFEAAVIAVLRHLAKGGDAESLVTAIAEGLGDRVKTDAGSCLSVFPGPATLKADGGVLERLLEAEGRPREWAGALRSLAGLFVGDAPAFDANGIPEEELQKIDGIVELSDREKRELAVCMFMWPDVLLSDDPAVRAAFAAKGGASWDQVDTLSPWRSYYCASIIQKRLTSDRKEV